MDKPAVRLQYGLFNYAEGGTPDYFGEYETQMRSGAPEFNVGKVYRRVQRQVGGVAPGDNGLLPSWPRWHWVGVFRAAFNPSGLPTQTILSQWGATPTSWSGDAPLQLQEANTRNAPWLRAAKLGNVRNLFSSGTDLVGRPQGDL